MRSNRSTAIRSVPSIDRSSNHPLRKQIWLDPTRIHGPPSGEDRSRKRRQDLSRGSAEIVLSEPLWHVNLNSTRRRWFGGRWVSETQGKSGRNAFISRITPPGFELKT
jgi:hypothetical protein